MRIIKWVINSHSGIQVMKIGTRLQSYIFLPNGFIVILDQGGICPILIGGVISFLFTSTQKCPNYSILSCLCHFTPLLELNNDGCISPFFILSRQNKIYALTG